MASEFKLYPSGFIGPDHLKQSERDGVGEMAHALMDRTRTYEAQRYTYSLQAEKFGKILLHESRRLTQFDVQEELVVFAKQALPDMSLQQWLGMQYDSTEFSHYHNLYLEESLRFACDQVRRTYHLQLWCNMVTADATAPYIGRGLSRKVKDSIEYMNAGPAPTTHDLLRAWLGRPDGLADLAGFLFVMYGPRQG